jgi:hypothetical protein
MFTILARLFFRTRPVQVIAGVWVSSVHFYVFHSNGARWPALESAAMKAPSRESLGDQYPAYPLKVVSWPVFKSYPAYGASIPQNGHMMADICTSNLTPEVNRRSIACKSKPRWSA